MNDDDEIICFCMGITAKEINDAIEEGATTFEEIQEMTEAGTVCGICEEKINELIEKSISSN